MNNIDYCVKDYGQYYIIGRKDTLDCLNSNKMNSVHTTVPQVRKNNCKKLVVSNSIWTPELNKHFIDKISSNSNKNYNFIYALIKNDQTTNNFENILRTELTRSLNPTKTTCVSQFAIELQQLLEHKFRFFSDFTTCDEKLLLDLHQFQMLQM